MPYYEYVCEDCNTKYEMKRCLAEIDDPSACPQCHGTHVARQMSRVMAFTHGDGGTVSALGSESGCGSCGGGSCGSCGCGNSHN